MAEEIKIGASIEAANGTFIVPKEGSTIQLIDQNNAGGGGPGVIDVTVADTVLTFPDITVLGCTRFENLDATNFVEFGPEAAGAIVPFLRLNAGEAYVFRIPPGTVMRKRANTGTVKVKITALED